MRGNGGRRRREMSVRAAGGEGEQAWPLLGVGGSDRGRGASQCTLGGATSVKPGPGPSGDSPWLSRRTPGKAAFAPTSRPARAVAAGTDATYFICSFLVHPGVGEMEGTKETKPGN